MTSLAASLFVIAIGIAANPPGIIVQIGLLGSKNGVRKAFIYFLGLLVSLLAFAAVAYVIFGRSDLATSTSAPSQVRWGIHVLGGLIVIGVGVWLWRQPAEAVGGFIGKALADLDHVKLGLAFLLGFLLVNYPLELVGATTIISANLGTSTAIAYFIAFAVVATSTIWLPIALAIAIPKRWERWSESIRKFVVAEGNAVLGGLIMLIGVLIVVQAVLGYLGK